MHVFRTQGHTARVLHMAQSPDGTTVVSAGADETLRFWKCFAEAPTVQKVPAFSPCEPAYRSQTKASSYLVNWSLD